MRGCKGNLLLAAGTAYACKAEAIRRAGRRVGLTPRLSNHMSSGAVNSHHLLPSPTLPSAAPARLFRVSEAIFC